ncbi:MAG: T9SS type A sorting domain-containing protein [Candidatus Zixiibacteriota bacterium]|nr:MAG: T9SS type A sorting domain-containing protein [candidate division Zixibacteria bacterium]
MRHTFIRLAVFPIVLSFFWQPLPAFDGKLLPPVAKKRRPALEHFEQSTGKAFLSRPSPRNLLGLERDKPWRLPKRGIAASAAQPLTLRILVLRFDFVEDNDPLTTGNGKFDFRDIDTFYEQEGHFIDPAPHNRAFFEAHMEALKNYYLAVSESTLTLEYEVYPVVSDSVYHLPDSMGHYGSIIPEYGVADMYTDCMQLVDSSEPGINFANYDSYFLFHAGSDRQDDVVPPGYPGSTPHDIYSGFIVMVEPVPVNDSTFEVIDGLIMPETGSQDGRVVALNATIAHEFGHQLGLVDLYNTGTIPPLTRVGDFALMDNMGRGTVVDLELPAGPISDMFPVFPMAWSRAFLGFTEPVTLRQGASLELAAAAMVNAGVEVVRVPISDLEYFLLENRQVDIDGDTTYPIADAQTIVVLGPGKPVIDPVSGDTDLVLTGEYDILLPGSGMLIWHVDESIASDEIAVIRSTLEITEGPDPETTIVIDTSTYTRYDYNMMQVMADRPFVELLEADGYQQFGRGYYVPGYVGIQQDMYYQGNNTTLDPYSNPPSVTFTGANSDVYITEISASDTIMSFRLGHDFISPGFPRRAGYPAVGLSPIAADLDGDGGTELIVISGDRISIISEDGTDFWEYDPVFLDTAYSSIGTRAEIVPLFMRRPDTVVTADPVVGDFGVPGGAKYLAVGSGRFLHVYEMVDEDPVDGEPDLLFASDDLGGGSRIVWLSFGDSILTAINQKQPLFGNTQIEIHTYSIAGPRLAAYPSIEKPLIYGAVQLNENFAIVAGDELTTWLCYVQDGDLASYDLEGIFEYGPVAADLDRDGNPEVVVATYQGVVKVVTIDTASTTPGFSFKSIDLCDLITVNPIISDLDEDGYPDIILGGQNRVYALNRNLIALTDYPQTIDRAYPQAILAAAPMVADVNTDGRQDIIAVTSEGNCYALGPDVLFGFPVLAGGVRVDSVLTHPHNGGQGAEFTEVAVSAIGSPVLFSKGEIGGLGFLGADGWFYSYDIWFDSGRADWAMNGGDASGGFYYPAARAGELPPVTAEFPRDKLYCYPNPSLDGRTTLRYYVGGSARLTLNVYDLTGVLVYEDSFFGQVGDEEKSLDLSFLPTGIYRCKVKAEIGGSTSSAFTDLAIVK